MIASVAQTKAYKLGAATRLPNPLSTYLLESALWLRLRLAWYAQWVVAVLRELLPLLHPIFFTDGYVLPFRRDDTRIMMAWDAGLREIFVGSSTSYFRFFSFREQTPFITS